MDPHFFGLCVSPGKVKGTCWTHLVNCLCITRNPALLWCLNLNLNSSQCTLSQKSFWRAGKKMSIRSLAGSKARSREFQIKTQLLFPESHAASRSRSFLRWVSRSCERLTVEWLESSETSLGWLFQGSLVFWFVFWDWILFYLIVQFI